MKSDNDNLLTVLSQLFHLWQLQQHPQLRKNNSSRKIPREPNTGIKGRICAIPDCNLCLCYILYRSGQQWRSKKHTSILTHFRIIITIISACSCPLPDIGLPNWFPAWSVRCHLHPTTPHSLDEVVGPSGREASHAALSYAWSSFQYLFAPSAVRLHFRMQPITWSVWLRLQK